MSSPNQPSPRFGLPARVVTVLHGLFRGVPAVERVWVYGSRASGRERSDSDVDLAVDAPDLDDGGFARLAMQVEAQGLLFGVDLVHWQRVRDPAFRAAIERGRAIFWQPPRHPASAQALGGVSLKDFQACVLDALGGYIDELQRHRRQAKTAAQALAAMEDMQDLARQAADYPKKTWAALKKANLLPPAFADQPHSSRFDGAGRAVPNVCLKVPTGGGKTLLAAAAVARIQSSWLHRHTGLVLWVVPNEAIYRQTLAALGNRDHPYRQILNVAGAGRVKVLEKTAPLTRLDVDGNLCVMVLMLQAAARQTKETLRFFRDRGNVLGFLPRDDDLDAHWALLQQVPNLDVYRSWGTTADEARATRGAVIKSSLGNVMRLLRPVVVIDEGHHAYTDNALSTIDGFNPSFMLELSATPRVAAPAKAGKVAGKAPASGSNILADVRGTDLDAADMIKLPIHVEVRRWADWRSCLSAAVQRLQALQQQADDLRADTLRYIRPILLVQVERTGADQRDAGFIHADDARAHLLQLGFAEAQIAVKTSEKNDLAQPENIDLLSPQCEVRAIITKQALQEGWDCPFAYVLCALAAGRQPAAMTQLVGRILRQPQVAKTGRPDLDACWVLCHDAGTAQVVQAIKRSLEEEGMGDLGVRVTGDAVDDADVAQPVPMRRRPALRDLRLYLPRVCWLQPGQPRRELDYEADVLAHLPWDQVQPDRLVRDWAPGQAAVAGADAFDIDLSILARAEVAAAPVGRAASASLDRAWLVRAVLDLAPNPWWVWAWVDAVVAQQLQAGVALSALAASQASLAEALRAGLERERDRLAQTVFNDLLAQGRIEFTLRADAADYELPQDAEALLAGTPALMQRSDARPMDKSLLEPCLRTPDTNEFEVAVAGYLDQQAALRWWHRNVARSQYGLQGWRRHRVYPDFVFALTHTDGAQRMVLLETKGLQLAGSIDTDYKRALLHRLTQAFADARLQSAGQMALVADGQVALQCDLVFEQAWQGQLDHRYFAAAGPEPVGH